MKASDQFGADQTVTEGCAPQPNDQKHDRSNNLEDLVKGTHRGVTANAKTQRRRATEQRMQTERATRRPLKWPRWATRRSFRRPLQGPLAGRGQDHEKPDGKRSEEGGHPPNALGSHIKPSPAGDHKTGQDGGDKGRHGQKADAGFRPLRARVIPIQENPNRHDTQDQADHPD